MGTRRGEDRDAACSGEHWPELRPVLLYLAATVFAGTVQLGLLATFFYLNGRPAPRPAFSGSPTSVDRIFGKPERSAPAMAAFADEPGTPIAPQWTDAAEMMEVPAPPAPYAWTREPAPSLLLPLSPWIIEPEPERTVAAEPPAVKPRTSASRPRSRPRWKLPDIYSPMLTRGVSLSPAYPSDGPDPGRIK